MKTKQLNGPGNYRELRETGPRPLKMRKNNSFVQILAVITSQYYIIYIYEKNKNKKQKKTKEIT